MKLTKKKVIINENKQDPRIGLGVWFEYEMY